MRILKYRYSLIAFILLSGLTTYLFFPVLFLDRSLVHADNLHHGYAFLKFHHDVIHNGLSPFWTNLVYGGHALFAEAQAGLSNPVNYLVAWLLRPELGHNVIHWLSMIATGVGTYGLCRTLDLKSPSALFATLAATFSSLFIHTNTNMTAIGAMVWIPWTLWAFEAWLKKPVPLQAVLFGLSTAMLVFSGYPHFLHGTVVYMLASSATLFIAQDAKQSPVDVINTYWRTAVIAVAVCVGISAVQWLPLLELSAQSHRQDGTTVTLSAPAEYALRGLIYSSVNTIATENEHSLYFPSMGSLLVCLLASLVLFLPAPARIRGHALAVFLLLNLGLGDSSPLYRLINEYHLIPGTDKFRILFPYFYNAIIGIAVLAAHGLDKAGQSDWRSWRQTIGAGGIARLLFFLPVWAGVIFALHLAEVPTVNYVIGGTAVLMWALAVQFKASSLVAPGCIVLLLVEISLLKLQPFESVDNAKLLEEPPSATYIKSTPDYMHYKHYHIGLIALIFTSPYGEKLDAGTRHELSSIVASSNLLWGIPSFSGALALQLEGRPAVAAVVIDEIKGTSALPPGRQLMDIYGIRWITKSNSPTAESLVPVKNARGRTFLMENPNARPRAQVYHKTSYASNSEEALSALLDSEELTLVLEDDESQTLRRQRPLKAAPVELKTLEEQATRYRFKSRSDTPFWLFLADSHYPGWHARINGKPTDLYRAQVLGKALYVPAGDNKIEVYFESTTLKVGGLLSGLTTATLSLLALLSIHGRRKRNTAG